MAGSFSKRKQKKLLELLREGYSISSACKNAGVDRSWLYKFRKKDDNKGFAEAMEDAISEGVGIYEDELRTRVLDGEPILDRDGNHVGDRKSDRLLEFVLKSKDRETYGDRQRTEVTGKDGGPVQQIVEGAILTDDQKRARLREIKEALGKRD